MWFTPPHGDYQPHTSTEKAFNIIAMLINLVNVLGNGFVIWMFASDKGLWEARTFLVRVAYPLPCMSCYRI